MQFVFIVTTELISFSLTYFQEDSINNLSLLRDVLEETTEGSEKGKSLMTLKTEKGMAA